MSAAESSTPGAKRASCLVVGRFPVPGAVAAAQRDGGSDGTAVDENAIDRDVAFGGERLDRDLHEALHLVMMCGGGAHIALPTTGFERKEILDLFGDCLRLGARGEQQRAEIAEAAHAAAQFTVPVRRDRVFEIGCAIVTRHQLRPAVTREIGKRHLQAAQRRRQRNRKMTVFDNERQQQQARQRRIARNISEPCGDHGIRRLALDKRRTERRIGMRPRLQNRQRQAVAAPHHARREKAKKLLRLIAGPHQHRADIAAEYRARRQREGRLVKHVGLERAAGEAPPFVRYCDKIGEPAPFHGKRTDRIAVGENGAAGAGDRRNGSLQGNTRSVIRIDGCQDTNQAHYQANEPTAAPKRTQAKSGRRQL